MILKKIAITLAISFWPLSVLLNNSLGEVSKIAFPTLLLFFSFFLEKRGSKFYLLPISFVPFFDVKLLILPLIYLPLDFLFFRTKHTLFFIILTLTITTFYWNTFRGQTIFVKDYEAQQEVIRKSQLYPTILTARFFQNKVRVVWEKYLGNFFAITDPNNYFFAYHPRELIGNQNLTKLPFLSILFISIGLYFTFDGSGQKVKYKKETVFIIKSLLASIFSLSLLTIFDRHDFILWLPISLLLIRGMETIEQKFMKIQKPLYLTFILISVIELTRIIIEKT